MKITANDTLAQIAGNKSFVMSGDSLIHGVGTTTGNFDLRDDVHQSVRLEQASSLMGGIKGAAIGGFTVAGASMAAGCFEPSTIAYGIIGGAVSGFIKS